MSITDELREVAAKTECANGRCEKLYRGDLEHIADRIDAEHQKCIDAMWEDAKSHLSDESLTELGWIRLPKDADGEYIHVGDEMCGYGWPNGGVYCRAIVNEVMILVGPQDGAYRGWLMWAANECRHHHAPTVEDVLREFAYGLGVPVADSYIAATAAKLRLAEGEDA